MLLLHQGHDGRDLVGDSVEQLGSQQQVLAGVVPVNEPQDKAEMVSNQPRSLQVPFRTLADNT